MDVGSANPTLNRNHVHPIRVTWPPVSEQRKIATILGTLDDKIELNRRMNETLEAMAQALFESLFVNAREDGLPEGWRESTIGEEVRVVGGSTPSTTSPEFWEGGSHYWATPKDLSAVTSPVLLDTERKITDAGVEQISSGLLPKGTVLLSSRAPIGYLVVSEVPVSVNQGFIAMVCDKELPNHYVRLWAKQNMETIEANANGTTFLEISKKNFRPLPIVVPSKDVIDQFVRQVEPLHKRIVSNLKESQTLAAMRDALLPKLLSGAIRAQITSAVSS
jgi:type I restriction enzyme S subunit